jgi:tRNA (guanine37-N1)-methyltransferase
MLSCCLVSLFPEVISLISEYGVTSRAVKSGLVRLNSLNIRDFSDDKLGYVDDRPYGGGAGMVLQALPVLRAIEAAKILVLEDQASQVKPWVVHLSPQGKTLNHQMLQGLQSRQALVLVASRYEGLDERVVDLAIDEEISIGDFVLSGGELPALTLIDALMRWVPGVLGDPESLDDSFSKGLLDYPHYTRPSALEWAGETRLVPEILLSGDHGRIASWRSEQARYRTQTRRPDLWVKWQEIP